MTESIARNVRIRRLYDEAVDVRSRAIQMAHTALRHRGRIDVATPYLREALRFIGISDVRFALIGPTTGPIEPSRLAADCTP